MDSKKYIGKNLHVKMDRQLGTNHPKWGFVYLTNYGYIPNTISGDGEELDAYVLGVYEPVEEFDGKCIAVVHRTNDNDDKLIIVPKEKEFTNEQIDVLIDYQERFFEHVIIR